ncbi:hypothetical protein BOH78_5388 [Pichia kudriavzevii]|uniref:Uncharacterized protein n=1 Tax=Pichia kudriavzevii TaxID=4909 RepID=A0A1V2LF48_PICKU|nr:hypothetical protein BOH78_5388 [Pichia kudriavzevii]
MDTHEYLEKLYLRTLLLVVFFNNKYSLALRKSHEKIKNVTVVY